MKRLIDHFTLASEGSSDRGWRPSWRVWSLHFSAALWVGTASAWAGCNVVQLEIPVRIIDRRPIATLSVNGTEVPMLVDSGAFFSFLSASTATQLKLPLQSLPRGLLIEGYTGRVEAKQTRVAKLGLLGAELTDVEFIVGGNELGAGIMGILGRNILAAADTEYDLAHGALRLSFPKGDCDSTNLAHWAGDAPVIVAPLGRSRDQADTSIRLDVRVNGKRSSAVLDTGAPQTSLTLKMARRAGIEERDLTPSGRVGGAGKGLAKSWTGRLELFELGGEKIANSHLHINDVDGDYGMLVGLDYFLSHRIYVSRLQRQVYITWNGGPVFAQNRLAEGDLVHSSAAQPPEVSPDDADALARRGAAATATGNFVLALSDLNRACELAPAVADYFDARARLRLQMRQPQLALSDFDEALRLDPALTEPRMRRSELRAALGDRSGALADLVQLNATLPASSALRADMAELHSSFDQAPAALQQFELWVNSHQKDARLASVLNSRCWMRARLKIDLPLALQDCKAAVDMDEDAAAYRDSLGWTYLRLGDAANAKQAFDGAIKLETLPHSLYGRGLALLRLNDANGSQGDLAAARKLSPSIEEVLRKKGFEFVDGTGRAADLGS